MIEREILSESNWSDICTTLDELITSKRTFLDPEESLMLSQNVDREISEYSDLELKEYLYLFKKELFLMLDMKRMLDYLKQLGMPKKFYEILTEKWEISMGWVNTTLQEAREQSDRLNVLFKFEIDEIESIINNS